MTESKTLITERIRGGLIYIIYEKIPASPFLIDDLEGFISPHDGQLRIAIKTLPKIRRILNIQEIEPEVQILIDRKTLSSYGDIIRYP